MIEPIWDDDRLRRAYRDRFGRPAPAGFAAAVAEAARRRGRSPSRLPAFVALAATLAIAIGLGAAALAPRLRDDDPERRFAHGLPILTVAEALEVRAQTNDSREIAVAGFLSLPDPGIRCRLSRSTSINPVRLECPDIFGWLLETEEPLDAIRSSLPPGRVGLQPLFPGLDTAELRAAEGPELPEVVLIGHFRDRRGQGALCDAVEIGACSGFVASAIASIRGEAVPASTVIDLEPLAPEPRREPVWSPDDVDRLVRATVPDLDVLSQVALPGHRIGELEPALGTGMLGVIDRPIAWLVNGLQPGPSGHPRLRTYLIVDGAPDEAYEAEPASRIGFTPIDLATPAVTPSPPAAPPSVDLAFPATVHGLEVVSVTDVDTWIDEATAGFGGAPPDTALAVRGYFVTPPSSIACPLPRRNIEPLHPIDRYCPEGIAWLMATEESPWELVDGVRRWRRPLAPSLNLVIPAAAPFGLPRPIANPPGPQPMPIVVIGHHGDDRSGRWDGTPRFIVDAVVWRAGTSTGDETIVLGDQPSETRAAVEARVARALGPARVTWTAVVDGSMLEGVDGSQDGELGRAHSVWQLGRLVNDGGRPVVRYTYTIDGSDRIWEPGGLAPERRVEFEAGGGRTVVVEILDWPNTIVGARDGRGEPEPANPRVISREVAVPFALSNPDGRPNELRIRWTATDCDARWRVWLGADGRYLDLQPTRSDDCGAVGVQVDIVLTLSEPLLADSVISGGGGAGG